MKRKGIGREGFGREGKGSEEKEWDWKGRERKEK